MQTLRSFATIAALAALLVPAGALAQVESTPIPTAAKPNFSSLSFLVGTWTCSTKSSRRPSPYQTTSTYTLDPTGYWISETSTIKPTSWVRSSLTTFDKITYDPETKRWVDVLYGDQGAYALSFSKGWNGDQITWHDVSFAPNADVRSQTDITLTKVSDTKVLASSSFTETKSGRTVTVASTCSKD